MRFRRGARLDPDQVTDVRGRRMGPGGLALGGGGLGGAALVIFLLISLLSGGGGLDQLAPLDGQQVGQGDTPSEVSQECRTGEDANERQDCHIVSDRVRRGSSAAIDSTAFEASSSRLLRSGGR